MKNSINDFALFGGEKLFKKVKPTSNLVKPNNFLLKKYLNLYYSSGSDYLIQMLECNLANYHRSKYCITFNSGFWALAHCVKLISRKSNTEVIIPSLTYRRLADLISFCGKKPVFCDVDKKSLALSVVAAEKLITNNTSLIIGVHPVGDHVDIDGLIKLSKKYNIPLIFDTVESVGETHKEKLLGGFGSCEVFSLGASKLINGFEGGYVTTNDSLIFQKLKHSSNKLSVDFGSNIPIPPINAIGALASLEEIEIHLEKNIMRFLAYKRELKSITELRLKEQSIHTNPTYKNIIIELLDDWKLSLNQTIKILNSENILARPYCPPITDNTIQYDHLIGKLSNTNWASKRFISMPCGYMVSEKDIVKIVSLFKSIKVHLDRNSLI